MELSSIDLSQPGRLRREHILKLFSTSKTSLYRGMQDGRYPKPDGHDGRMPYWLTSSIRPFMEPKK